MRDSTQLQQPQTVFTCARAVPIVTIDTATDRCTQQNTVHDKHQSSTCFDIGVSFSGNISAQNAIATPYLTIALPS